VLEVKLASTDLRSKMKDVVGTWVLSRTHDHPVQLPYGSHEILYIYVLKETWKNLSKFFRYYL